MRSAVSQSKKIVFKEEKTMLKINRKAKSLLTVLLAFVLFLSLGTQTVLADMNSNDRMDALFTEYGGGDHYSPGYLALAKMRSDYFLDFLPTENEPEALQLLTNIPSYDEKNGWVKNTRYPETGAWNGFFQDGYPTVMRDEAFRVAKKLDLTNQALSEEEKAERISDWAHSADCKAGPFAGDGVERVDGPTNNPGWVSVCTTRTEGLAALYRLAGIPAVGVHLYEYGKSHAEAFCYVNGEWRYAADYTQTFTEYFGRVFQNLVTGIPSYANADGVHFYYSTQEDVNHKILDINESWIDHNAEKFMFQLLRKPYAYPDKKLSRSEVAKLVCNYLGVVPMRNEQIFSDVELVHPYSRYIWAVNKLGIMTGDGSGHFYPDTELSMQEFAVMAMRMLEYGGQKIVENELEQIKEIENNPKDWPPDDPYTQEVLARSKEEADWRARLAINSYQNPVVFADNDKIASWAKSAIDEFSKLKILQGDSSGADSRLNPTEPLSKTRFLVFLYKIDQKLPLTVGGLIF
jgi:hypothetical protein